MGAAAIFCAMAQAGYGQFGKRPTSIGKTAKLLATLKKAPPPYGTPYDETYPIAREGHAGRIAPYFPPYRASILPRALIRLQMGNPTFTAGLRGDVRGERRASSWIRRTHFWAAFAISRPVATNRPIPIGRAAFVLPPDELQHPQRGAPAQEIGRWPLVAFHVRNEQKYHLPH